MGLLDRLMGGRQEALTPQAALLLCAITMISADGDVDDDELAIVRRLDGPQQTRDWDLAVRTWKSNTIEDSITMATAALSLEQRTAVLANLIDIAMADGALHGSEKKLLETYISKFGVDNSLIEKMVDVISLKNSKSIFR